MITQIPKPLQRLISRPLLVLAMLVGILIPSRAMGAPAFASGVYQVTASPYLNVSGQRSALVVAAQSGAHFGRHRTRPPCR